MSREQWGSGFHSGIKAAASKQLQQENFPVGFYFTTKKDDKIQYQGVVKAKCGDVYVVKYFSWVMGELGDSVYSFKIDDMKDWTWYQSAKDMRRAIAYFNNWDWDEDND